MKSLYLIHCGFYDPIAGDKIYEIHTNLFVVADSFEDAKKIAKAKPEFKAKKMHVDGMQQIRKVDGYVLSLNEPQAHDSETLIENKKSSFA